MLELVAALVVLTVAGGGTLSAISSASFLSRSSDERTLAASAAKDVAERLRAESFREVFARYNDDPSDDVGPAPPGAHFDVAGLDPRPGDADGRVGRILFPVAAATPTSLFENQVDDLFGFPRDLNGDGAIDALDHAGDYRVLPVRVVVEWRGRSGNRRFEITTLLGDL